MAIRSISDSLSVINSGNISTSPPGGESHSPGLARQEMPGSVHQSAEHTAVIRVKLQCYNDEVIPDNYTK